MAERKSIDCRKSPSASNCTVKLSGKPEELLPLAVHHAVTAHGAQDTPELREELQQMMEDET